MGQTREKKPSKRALKDEANVAIKRNLSTTPESIVVADNQGMSSGKHLTIPRTSRQSSRSSLRSSASSRESSSTPIPYKCRVQVREVEGRGFCLFATQSIARGALVLADLPAIRLTDEDEAKVDRAEEVIFEKFKVLDKAQRKSFRKLHNSEKEGFSEVRSIYHTNCYNLAGHRSRLGGSCVGLQASRINHSCLPNVQFSFLGSVPEEIKAALQDETNGSQLDGPTEIDTSRGVMLFHAIKKISKGQEILANYEPVYLTSAQRQAKLRMYYGFVCDCKACGPGDNSFWLKSDDRRSKMIRLRDAVRKAEDMWHQQAEHELEAFSPRLDNLSTERDVSRIIVKDAVEALDKLIELLELEGLSGIDLLHVYRKLVVWTKRDTSFSTEAREHWQHKVNNLSQTIYGSFKEVFVTNR